MSFLKAIYNGVTFFLDDGPTITEKPELDPKLGRSGTATTVDAALYVQGNSGEQLASLIGTAKDALRSGRDLVLLGHGDAVLFSLLASRCLIGGPHPTIKSSHHATIPFRYVFNVSFEATTSGDGDDPDDPAKLVKDAYKLTQRKRPDELEEIIRAGKLSGVDVVEKFEGKIRDDWRKLFDLPKWVVESDYTLNNAPDGKEIEYQLRAVELHGDLPATAAGDATAVSGTYEMSVDRDEQMRVSTTRVFDLIILGDPQKMIDFLRPKKPAIVLRESVSIQRLTENRIKATFVEIKAGSGTLLMNYRETFTVLRGGIPLVEEKTYPGAAPLLVRLPARVSRITQEGRAVSEGSIYQGPKPLYPEQMTTPPRISFVELNAVEKETSWRYEFARLPSQPELNPLVATRDTDPEFFK